VIVERYFQLLDKPGLHRFQGGAVILQAYGCGQCGHGFWVEENRPSEAPVAGSVMHCPRCGTPGLVPDRSGSLTEGKRP
jgi:hypothetical protein